MNILVTGGTGYIGSHTVVELQQQGHRVVIADDLSNSEAIVVNQIEKITGILPEFELIDLTDSSKTRDFFKRHHTLDAVIHFAAAKSVNESMANPMKYYRNNLVSLMNLLEGMETQHKKLLVFSSSCTVYGQPDSLPVNETAPLKEAWSPYGHTKQISEAIIERTCRVSGIQAVLLRYFNPIGAHESALIGELPIGEPNNLVPYITQTAIGKRSHLRVFGNDYSTHDGTAIRDYIHVVDLAQAHVVALERLAQEKNKKQVEVFNLGTGQGYTVLEVIRSFEKISGIPLNYTFENRRPGDIEKVWADTTHANEELGWKATHGLDDMMRSAWNWELNLAQRSSNL